MILSPRLAAASGAQLDPARPKNSFMKAWATITALARELSQATPHAPIPLCTQPNHPLLSRILYILKHPQLSLPPLGYVILLGANISLVLSISFWKFNLSNNWSWEDIAFRCAWMTLTQLPLIFLMAGKRNIVGALTGTSYERLNLIHRWAARCLFITATCHLAFFFKTWARYHYIKKKLQGDIVTKRGFTAWCVLLWIIISSFTPIRNIRYEIFVVQHIISYVAFTTLVMLHVPEQARVWVWVSVGIYLTDRSFRTLYLLYHNLSIFHRRREGLVTCRATFLALTDGATLVTIPNPTFKWNPGQHAFLHCPSIIPLQSHPFTISSLPSDGKLEFVVRAHQGGTRRLFQHAKESLPPTKHQTVLIDGPYGRMRPLEQFDMVVLIAGSTGATFTVPLLRDIVQRSRNGEALVTRKVKFIWVVKNKSQVGWFVKEITETMHTSSTKKEKAQKDELVVEASLYITCDASQTMDIKDLDTNSSSNLNASTEKQMLCGGSQCCSNLVLEGNSRGATPTPVSMSPPPTSKTCTCGTTTPVASRPLTKPVQAGLSLPASIHVETGRPALRVLVNKELEQARGEAAVVVCGPKGLRRAVRREVTGLCDERAVCKGSGADGVYLHVEGFGW